MTNPLTGQPLTRRELRALAEGNPASLPVTPEVVAPPSQPPQAYVAPPAPPAPEPAPTGALTRREARLREGLSDQPPTSVSQQPPLDAPVAPIAVTPVSPLADLVARQLAPIPQQPASAALPPVFSQPTTAESPLDALSVAVSPSRSVGTAPVTTSSLILPVSPNVDMAGPLGTTGEIILTGQIRLPGQLAEIGSYPITNPEDAEDSSDPYVTGDMAAVSQPMRALQAVSSKGDDTDILLVKRTRWGTGAVVTALGASLLGLASVALVVLVFMTDVLA